MNGFIAVLGKELREQWRTYRFLVALALIGLFGLLSPLMAYFMPEMFKMIPGGEAFVGMIPAPTVTDALGQYIKNTSQFAIILAILLPMGAVVQEKEKGTAALMLSKPLPRGSFLLAKFAAYTLVFGVSILVAGLAGYYYTGLLFEFLPFGKWMAMNALLLLYTLVYVALTLFFSTLGKSQAFAGGLSLAVLALLAIFGAFPSLAQYLPAHLVTWSATLWVPGAATQWTVVWISTGVVLAALAAAWLIFRRQEL